MEQTQPNEIQLKDHSFMEGGKV